MSCCITNILTFATAVPRAQANTRSYPSGWKYRVRLDIYPNFCIDYRYIETFGTTPSTTTARKLIFVGRHVPSPCAPIVHFVQLCVSKEEEVKESFKGKDMTYEQYQQLKQLNDSHGQGPKEDETDTKDNADAAKRR